MQSPQMICWKCRTTAPMPATGAWISVQLAQCTILARHDLGWWRWTHIPANNFFECPACLSLHDVATLDATARLGKECEGLHDRLDASRTKLGDVEAVHSNLIDAYARHVQSLKAKPVVSKTVATTTEHPVVVAVLPSAAELIKLHGDLQAGYKSIVPLAEFGSSQPIKIEPAVPDRQRCELCGLGLDPSGDAVRPWAHVDSGSRRFLFCQRHDLNAALFVAGLRESAFHCAHAALPQPLTISIHHRGTVGVYSLPLQGGST